MAGHHAPTARKEREPACQAEYHRGGNLHISWQERMKEHWLRPPYTSGPAYAHTSIPWFSAYFILFMQFRASAHRMAQPSDKVKLPTSMA